MIIYLVNAGTDYEGHSTICAFNDKEKAEELAQKCRDIAKFAPMSPAFEAPEAEWEIYATKYDLWKIDHPAGIERDYYFVEEVELN